MKKVTLYSRSVRGSVPQAPAAGASCFVGYRGGAAAQQNPPAAPSPSAPVARRIARFERALFLVGGALFALILVAVHGSFSPATPALTQKDIDAAVLYTLENVPMQAHAAKAYAAVQRSVVRVRGGRATSARTAINPKAWASGVVIVDTGIILTNLHVVYGAEQVQVEFFDGLESEATVDRRAARARSRGAAGEEAARRSRVRRRFARPADLAVGDEVVAVGFPFGIGPSVSAGVVSGLKREYRSPQGKRHADQPDPVRRRGQSRQLGRSARHRRRRGGRHRHRHPQSDRAARVHRHRLRGSDRERGRAQSALSPF